MNETNEMAHYWRISRKCAITPRQSDFESGFEYTLSRYLIW